MRRPLLTFMLICLLVLLTACSAPTPASQAISAANAQENQTYHATDVPDSEGCTPSTIGTAERLGDWEITVNSFAYNDEITENNMFVFAPDEGNQYLTVDVTVKNLGKEMKTFLPSFVIIKDEVIAKVVYNNEYAFSSTQLLGYSKNLRDESLNPLSIKSGEISFSIPDDVRSSSNPLLLVFTLGKKTLTYSLR